MDINQAYPSKWLTAPDLFGQAMVYVMTHTGIEDIGRGEHKPVLHFQNVEKGMVLNITNANTISDIYGHETDNWTGKPIELYPTTTEFNGRMVPCIRLRTPQPQATQPAQAAPAQTPQQQGNVSQAPTTGPAPGYQTGDPLNYDV